MAIAGFAARQDISVGCRDCTCAGTGRQPVTGDVESCRVGGVRSSADNWGHGGAGAQSLANQLVSVRAQEVRVGRGVGARTKR